MSSCLDPITLVKVLSYSPDVSEKCEFILNSVTQLTQTNFSQYIFVFLSTCLLELLFYFWVLKKYSYLSRLLGLGIANLATHPIVYFLLPWLFSKQAIEWKYYLLTAEIFAPIAEAIILSVFFKIGWGRSILLMLAANLFSWGLGVYLLH